LIRWLKVRVLLPSPTKRDKRALVAGVLDGTGAAGKLSTKEMLALLTPVDRP